MSLALLAGLLSMTAVGISLGFLGAGGSAITVPVLVYILGFEPRQAIGASLAIVGATSAWGAILNFRNHTLIWRVGLVFSVTGIAGAWFGSRLTYLCQPALLMVLFAALLAIVGTLMYLRNPRAEPAEPRALCLWKCATAGVIVGLLTGFLGVGGGFLIVPALLWFGGLPVKQSIGTSLMVIALNSAAGLAGHLSRMESIDYPLLFELVLAALGGMVVGSVLLRRTSPGNLRKAFAAFLILIALFLLAKNAPQLF
ncbi:MAG: sulfite exporter TauE/SafE family protein [Bryobacteraceae bacterium]|nr:sulfite exporter TauE/SafE family protein [Bryobacteraceae bacterium]